MALGTAELVAELVELIHSYGSLREQTRMEVRAVDPEQASASFSADLVYQDERGFELWLGSLEDALSLEALEQHKIDGILNCAVSDCQLECACSRPSQPAGRRRCHARGPSAYKGGFGDGPSVEGGTGRFDRDQIRELANFDETWYSTILSRDIEYLGIAAADAPGYAMDAHFPDTSAFLARCRMEGRKVLVHCIQGVNRSSAALVAFLCEHLVMPLDDAVVLASTRRGLILSNDSFLAQLVHRYGHTSSSRDALRANCKKSLSPGCAQGDFANAYVNSY